MRHHDHECGDGFFTFGARSVKVLPRELIHAHAKSDIGDPDEIEKQIRQLIDAVDSREITWDVVASRVDQLDKLLAAIVGAYPPPVTFNISDQLVRLAGHLLASGAPERAELMVLRAAQLNADKDGKPRINEMQASQLADIWDVLGKHADAANLVYQAALVAQRRLWPEPVVFNLLYQCAASAMLAEDYSLAAKAYARARQMNSVDPRRVTWICGVKHMGYQKQLFKIKALPVYDLQLAPVEVEYDRIMEEQRRAEAKQRRAAGR